MTNFPAFEKSKTTLRLIQILYVREGIKTQNEKKHRLNDNRRTNNIQERILCCRFTRLHCETKKVHQHVRCVGKSNKTKQQPISLRLKGPCYANGLHSEHSHPVKRQDVHHRRNLLLFRWSDFRVSGTPTKGAAFLCRPRRRLLVPNHLSLLVSAMQVHSHKQQGAK